LLTEIFIRLKLLSTNRKTHLLKRDFIMTTVFNIQQPWPWPQQPIL